MAKSYWWQQNATVSVFVFMFVVGSTAVANATSTGAGLVLDSSSSTTIHNTDETAYDLLQQENLYVDDTYTLQSVIDADKKKAEEEAKRAEEEAERQRQATSKKVAKQLSIDTGTDTVAGRFRVGSNNDSDSEIIRKLNIYYSGTPMEGLGEVTLNAGKANNINPYLISAIADTESSRALYNCNTNNCFGRKALIGWMSFDSLAEAIEDEASYLAKYYVNQGLVTVAQIGNKYCVGGNWANKVSAQINRISNL